MKIAPFNSRLIVSPVTSEYKRTDGGIDLENDVSEGVIVEVSIELKELLEVDDHILYNKGSGQNQYYKGKACLWLSNSEIYGKVSYEDEIESEISNGKKLTDL